MAVMTFISISNIWGFNIAGMTVVIGIVFFIINRSIEKDIPTNNELNMRHIVKYLKDNSTWLWILLPLVMNIISFTLATLFLPDFIKHIYSRTEFVVSLNNLLLLILQLAILALGEEIAWRGFFQKQLNKWMPIIPSIIFTSIVFSLAHFTFGSIGIVSYDLIFIFVNSVLYGVIFNRTNNVWISAIAHFIANLFGIIIILIVL